MLEDVRLMMAHLPLVFNVKWPTLYTIIYTLIIVRRICDTTAFFSSNQFYEATCSHLMHTNPRVIFCNKLLLKPSSLSSHRYNIIYPQPRITNIQSYQSTTRHMAKSTNLNSHDGNQYLPPTSNDSSNNDVCIRILCLHGKGGNGHQFINSSLLPLRSLVENRLSSLNDNNEEEGYSNISFQWDSLTAPYEISPPTDNEEKDDGGYSWWTMPPGVRSYNANEVRTYL